MGSKRGRGGVRQVISGLGTRLHTVLCHFSVISFIKLPNGHFDIAKSVIEKEKGKEIPKKIWDVSQNRHPFLYK